MTPEIHSSGRAGTNGSLHSAWHPRRFVYHFAHLHIREVSHQGKFSFLSTSFLCSESLARNSLCITGVEGIQKDLNASHEVATVGLSLFVLGFGIGPLIWV